MTNQINVRLYFSPCTAKFDAPWRTAARSEAGADTTGRGIAAEVSQPPAFVPLSPKLAESLAVLHAARQGREERLRATARKGDEIIVSLKRLPREQHVSWGLELDELTMELTDCVSGTSAARHPPVCACIGLVLAKIHSSPVRSHSCVLGHLKACTSVELRFHPADTLRST